jgi:Domain of unknown function (DUF5615)
LSDSSITTGSANLPETQSGFRFFTDHNVPESIANILLKLGNDVVRLRDVIPINSPDPIVATYAIEAQRILVSWDRDFNQQKFQSPRYEKLSRLSMSGPEMNGAERLDAVFDIVKFAINRASGAPITIRVGSNKIQIHV